MNEWDEIKMWDEFNEMKPWEGELNEMNKKKRNAKKSADRLIFFLVIYFVLFTLWFCFFYLNSATLKMISKQKPSSMCTGLYDSLILFDVFYTFSGKCFKLCNFFITNLTYVQYLQRKLDKVISPNFQKWRLQISLCWIPKSTWRCQMKAPTLAVFLKRISM